MKQILSKIHKSFLILSFLGLSACTGWFQMLETTPECIEASDFGETVSALLSVDVNPSNDKDNYTKTSESVFCEDGDGYYVEYFDTGVDYVSTDNPLSIKVFGNADFCSVSYSYDDDSGSMTTGSCEESILTVDSSVYGVIPNAEEYELSCAEDGGDFSSFYFQGETEFLMLIPKSCIPGEDTDDPSCSESIYAEYDSGDCIISNYQCKTYDTDNPDDCLEFAQETVYQNYNIDFADDEFEWATATTIPTLGCNVEDTTAGQTECNALNGGNGYGDGICSEFEHQVLQNYSNFKLFQDEYDVAMDYTDAQMQQMALQRIQTNYIIDAPESPNCEDENVVAESVGDKWFCNGTETTSYWINSVNVDDSDDVVRHDLQYNCDFDECYVNTAYYTSSGVYCGEDDSSKGENCEELNCDDNDYAQGSEAYEYCDSNKCSGKEVDYFEFATSCTSAREGYLSCIDDKDGCGYTFEDDFVTCSNYCASWDSHVNANGDNLYDNKQSCYSSYSYCSSYWASYLDKNNNDSPYKNDDGSPFNNSAECIRGFINGVCEIYNATWDEDDCEKGQTNEECNNSSCHTNCVDDAADESNMYYGDYQACVLADTSIIDAEYSVCLNDACNETEDGECVDFKNSKLEDCNDDYTNKLALIKGNNCVEYCAESATSIYKEELRQECCEDAGDGNCVTNKDGDDSPYWNFEAEKVYFYSDDSDAKSIAFRLGGSDSNVDSSGYDANDWVYLTDSLFEVISAESGGNCECLSLTTGCSGGDMCEAIEKSGVSIAHQDIYYYSGPPVTGWLRAEYKKPYIENNNCNPDKDGGYKSSRPFDPYWEIGIQHACSGDDIYYATAEHDGGTRYDEGCWKRRNTYGCGGSGCKKCYKWKGYHYSYDNFQNNYGQGSITIKRLESCTGGNELIKFMIGEDNPEFTLTELQSLNNNGTIPYTGRIYVRVSDTDFFDDNDEYNECAVDNQSDYDDLMSNNSGTYMVSISTFSDEVELIDIFGLATKPFEDFFSDDFAETTFAGLVGEGSYFQTILTICMVLYIAFTGLMFLIGLSGLTQGELVKRIIKIGIIYMLISPTGWSYFYEYIIVAFSGGAESIAETFTYSLRPALEESEDVSESFYMFNYFFYFLFQEVVLTKTVAILFSPFIVGWLMVLLLVMAVFCVVNAIVKAIVMYVMIKVVMTLLFVVGPIFIIFLLFESTKGLFQNWLNMLISYAAQFIMLFIVINLFGYLLVTTLLDIYNFGVCWNNVLSLQLPIESELIPEFEILDFWQAAGYDPRYSAEYNAGQSVSFYSIAFFFALGYFFLQFIESTSKLADSITGGGASGGVTAGDIGKAIQRDLEAFGKAVGMKAGKVGLRAGATTAHLGAKAATPMARSAIHAAKGAGYSAAAQVASAQSSAGKALSNSSVGKVMGDVSRRAGLTKAGKIATNIGVSKLPKALKAAEKSEIRKQSLSDYLKAQASKEFKKSGITDLQAAYKEKGAMGVKKMIGNKMYDAAGSFSEEAYKSYRDTSAKRIREQIGEATGMLTDKQYRRKREQGRLLDSKAKDMAKDLSQGYKSQGAKIKELRKNLTEQFGKERADKYLAENYKKLSKSMKPSAKELSKKIDAKLATKEKQLKRDGLSDSDISQRLAIEEAMLESQYEKLIKDSDLIDETEIEELEDMLLTGGVAHEFMSKSKEKAAQDYRKLEQRKQELDATEEKYREKAKEGQLTPEEKQEFDDCLDEKYGEGRAAIEDMQRELSAKESTDKDEDELLTTLNEIIKEKKDGLDNQIEKLESQPSRTNDENKKLERLKNVKEKLPDTNKIQDQQEAKKIEKEQIEEEIAEKTQEIADKLASEQDLEEKEGVEELRAEKHQKEIKLKELEADIEDLKKQIEDRKKMSVYSNKRGVDRKIKNIESLAKGKNMGEFIDKVKTNKASREDSLASTASQARTMMQARFVDPSIKAKEKMSEAYESLPSLETINKKTGSSAELFGMMAGSKAGKKEESQTLTDELKLGKFGENEGYKGLRAEQKKMLKSKQETMGKDTEMSEAEKKLTSANLTETELEVAALRHERTKARNQRYKELKKSIKDFDPEKATEQQKREHEQKIAISGFAEKKSTPSTDADKIRDLIENKKLLQKEKAYSEAKAAYDSHIEAKETEIKEAIKNFRDGNDEGFKFNPNTPKANKDYEQKIRDSHEEKQKANNLMQAAYEAKQALGDDVDIEQVHNINKKLEGLANKQTVEKELVEKELVAKELIEKELVKEAIKAEGQVTKESIVNTELAKERPLVEKELVAKELIKEEIKDAEEYNAISDDAKRGEYLDQKVKAELEIRQNDPEFTTQIDDRLEEKNTDEFKAEFTAQVDARLAEKQNDKKFQSHVDATYDVEFTSQVEARSAEKKTAEFSSQVDARLAEKQNDAEFLSKVDDRVAEKQNDAEFLSKVDDRVAEKQNDAGFLSKVDDRVAEKQEFEKETFIEEQIIQAQLAKAAKNGSFEQEFQEKQNQLNKVTETIQDWDNAQKLQQELESKTNEELEYERSDKQGVVDKKKTELENKKLSDYDMDTYKKLKAKPQDELDDYEKESLQEFKQLDKDKEKAEQELKQAEQEVKDAEDKIRYKEILDWDNAQKLQQELESKTNIDLEYERSDKEEKVEEQKVDLENKKLSDDDMDTYEKLKAKPQDELDDYEKESLQKFKQLDKDKEKAEQELKQAEQELKDAEDKIRYKEILAEDAEVKKEEIATVRARKQALESQIKQAKDAEEELNKEIKQELYKEEQKEEQEKYASFDKAKTEAKNAAEDKIVKDLLDQNGDPKDAFQAELDRDAGDTDSRIALIVQLKNQISKFKRDLETAQSNLGDAKKQGNADKIKEYELEIARLTTQIQKIEGLLNAQEASMKAFSGGGGS